MNTIMRANTMNGAVAGLSAGSTHGEAAMHGTVFGETPGATWV
jgi:hypothetical protein